MDLNSIVDEVLPDSCGEDIEIVRKTFVYGLSNWCRMILRRTTLGAKQIWDV